MHVQLEGSYSALSPVVHGDIVLSIKYKKKKKYNNLHQVGYGLGYINLSVCRSLFMITSKVIIMSIFMD